MSSSAVFISTSWALCLTPDEARAFLSDKDPKKRSKLVDRLLADERFAGFWAMKWGDLLRIKTGVGVTRPAAAATYYRWVRDSLAHDKPYDQFVRELLTSRGSNYECGPANFFAPSTENNAQGFAEATALVFMGQRIGCARCHVHPEENWTPDDNLGLAAFFAAVSVKSTQRVDGADCLYRSRQDAQAPENRPGGAAEVLGRGRRGPGGSGEGGPGGRARGRRR